jgi:hypothetical protein
LCHMSGEMGNHLDIYAHCHIVRNLILSSQNVSASVAVRHATGGGWADTAGTLRTCFPHFQSVDFEAGSDAAYEQALLFQLKHEQQRQQGDADNTDEQPPEEVQLGQDQLVRTPFVTMVTRHEPDTVRSELDAFALRFRESDPTLLVPPGMNFTEEVGMASGKDESGGAAIVSGAGSPTPPAAIHPLSVLYVQWLFSVDAFVDQYILELRALYSFLDNSTDCCRAVPDPDETVYVRWCFACLLLRRSDVLLPYLTLATCDE